MYSGVYLMPISRSTSELLRECCNRAVVIDAIEVFQPLNPGDGLIRQLTLLDRSPDEDEWVPVAGLQIGAVADLSRKRPSLDIVLTNAGSTERRFMVGALAPIIREGAVYPHRGGSLRGHRFGREGPSGSWRLAGTPDSSGVTDDARMRSLARDVREIRA